MAKDRFDIKEKNTPLVESHSSIADMKNIHKLLLAWLCLISFSCGTVRHSTVATDTTLADSLWTFNQAHPDDFTADVEFVSPTNLIIMYDVEVGKEALMQAVKDYGAELLYDYSIIPGIAIKIPEGKQILEAIAYFNQVKGVTAVERDHIYHLIDPVRPKLEVM